MLKKAGTKTPFFSKLSKHYFITYVLIIHTIIVGIETIT